MLLLLLYIYVILVVIHLLFTVGYKILKILWFVVVKIFFVVKFTLSIFIFLLTVIFKLFFNGRINGSVNKGIGVQYINNEVSSLQSKRNEKDYYCQTEQQNQKQEVITTKNENKLKDE